MRPEFAQLFPNDVALIKAYAQSAVHVRQMAVGLVDDVIKARPIPGKWSSQEVFIHIADADAAFTHRLKRILAEDRPTYNKWNEDDFVANLFYHEQSAMDAVTLIEINHRQLSKIIAAKGLSCLDRKGVHSQAGEQSAREVLMYATWHIGHHLNFVKEKLAAYNAASS